MAMEITAVRSSRLRPPSPVGRTSASIVQLPTENARLSGFLALMKPRVMLLAVFTALVGFLLAPTHPDPLLGFIALLAIAMGAGAAGVLNMWYDADIDRVMSRTAMRPIPRGAVSRVEALVFGLALGAGSVAVLALAANLEAAGLLAFAIFFYVVVYTIWLKRCTPQNIVIGGAAGALPPTIGWAAATGEIGLEPIILFLIVFLWTPPHFWALALNRSDEYARAGIPMLPVVAGRTDDAADPDLFRHIGTDFGAAVGARVCRGDLWRNGGYLWCHLCGARLAAAPQHGDQSGRRQPPVRLLHLLSVRAVCGPPSQQRQSIVRPAGRASGSESRRIDNCRIPATHCPGRR
jgi:protoheme IX farnesyltransferase